MTGISTTHPDAQRVLIPPAESRRVAAIEQLAVLDRIGDPVLVCLTRLAQSITGAAAAAVHVLDARDQHRIAATDAPLGEHPIDDSMCRLVVDSEANIICSDALTEPRFAYSSFVHGPAPVRFYASVPMRVGDGTVVGTLCAFDTVPRELDDRQVRSLEDLAELASAHLVLAQLATDLGREASLDGLTGVLNRTMFDARVSEALSHRSREGGDLLVAVVDINDFKAINDTYGHERGDDALCWTAKHLIETVSPSGSVGRIGGDEFAILCPRGTADADGLIDTIHQIGAGFEPPFTLSVGVTSATADEDVPTHMRRADRLMYADKPARPVPVVAV